MGQPARLTRRCSQPDCETFFGGLIFPFRNDRQQIKVLEVPISRLQFHFTFLFAVVWFFLSSWNVGWIIVFIISPILRLPRVSLSFSQMNLDMIRCDFHPSVLLNFRCKWHPYSVTASSCSRKKSHATHYIRK